MQILIDASRIADRVHALAREIRADRPDSELLLLGVLKGGFVFLADLARALPGEVRVDFIQASSYGAGQVSTGEVRLLREPQIDVAGRNVLLVEDIIDSGLTVRRIQEWIRARGPRWFRTVSLLDKPARRQTAVAVDYVGFTIEDRFVVGYGLDLDERFRHLPYVGILDGETSV